MRTLKFLLQKEFRQIFRNPNILKMIIVIPTLQLLIMPLAADFEIKNINISIADHDRSTYAQKMVTKIISSGYFKLVDYENSFEHLVRDFEQDQADLVLEIPKHFEKDLMNGNVPSIFLAVNAINGIKAIVGSNYLGGIIANFSADLRREQMSGNAFVPLPAIEITSSSWFNPLLNYQHFMIPGFLVILVTMVSAYMCALNIVKEKEVGTIEQINVTPIRKFHFILGKLIPFWIISMIVFSIGMFFVARLVYGLVPLGSLVLLYGFLAVYLVALLGIGLLISTYSTNQQQAMSLAFFFMMLAVLMSGFFTDIESMPELAKGIAKLNPTTYFVEVIRMIIMKGSQFSDIKIQFLIMLGFALLFNSWAIFNYKKTI